MSSLPRLRHLFTLFANVDKPQVASNIPIGNRRFIPVIGGTAEGERIRGNVLPGGSDCQLIRSDGVAELDVRCTFETDDGVVFLMKGFGLRHGPSQVMDQLAKGYDVDPNEYYFRESVWFEAPNDSEYRWLNKVIGIATGHRKAAQVILQVYEVL